MKFLTNKPALITENSLVIGDLHLGIEYELYKSGFSLPSSINKILEMIKTILESEKVEKLILLGDVKHNVPEISFQESREIPIFLKELSNLVEVHIVPGNHDGKIENLSPENIIVHERKGFLLNDTYFNHGHTWPGKELTKAKRLIIAHLHPAIEFLDSSGYRYIEPCWLRCVPNAKKIEEKYGKKVRCENVIVVPAFNPIITGVPVNEKEVEDKLPSNPLVRNGIIKIEDCDVHLLDGTYLGKVKDLKISKKLKK
ncbi:MAG: metallophosphoesterase [Candidatus Aenigmarchaeota archaeon]|nr:metallophosphoesterase [Candidatus Aenigmarchaeota archaeon]